MYRFLLFFCCCFAIFSCNNKLKKENTPDLPDTEIPDPNIMTKEFISSAVIDTLAPAHEVDCCKDKASYIPDLEHVSHTPKRYLRLNFHVMCKADSTSNFSQKAGRAYINQVMSAANHRLSENKKMHLPLNNETPIVPIQYRYVLTPATDDPDDDGIYFHYDDELYFMVGSGKHKNIYDKRVYDKYGNKKDTILNVFVMANHEDSIVSPTYVADSKGIGFGSWLKVINWYDATRDTTWVNGKPKINFPAWEAIKLLNHEIGHCLGLRHTWRGNDGCDDTPQNPNCWNITQSAPCDSLWSNNVMDYNSRCDAWSPCQIGTVQYNFANKKARRLLDPRWCTLKDYKTIKIRDTVEWFGAKDLESHIEIRDGGSLTIRCRVSLPKGAKITIHPKGKLILDGAILENDCSEKWQGIERLAKNGFQGELILRNAPVIQNVENKIEIATTLR